MQGHWVSMLIRVSNDGLSGRVSITCVKTYERSKLLQKFLPLGLGLGLLVALCVLLLTCNGRRIIKDLANARVSRIKRRSVVLVSPSSSSSICLYRLIDLQRDRHSANTCCNGDMNTLHITARCGFMISYHGNSPKLIHARHCT